MITVIRMHSIILPCTQTAVLPETTEELRELVEGRGCAFIAAPVFGRCDAMCCGVHLGCRLCDAVM